MTTIGTNTKRVAYSTAAQLIGRLAVAGMGLVTLGVTTRALGIDLYGQFTAATIFVGLFSTLTDAGISNITIRELAQRKRSEGEIVGAVVVLRTLIATGAALLAVVLGQLLYHQPNQEPIRFATDVLSLTLIFGTLQSTLTSVLVADIRNDLVVIADVSGKFIAMLLTLYAVRASLGLPGITIAIVVGAAVSAIIAYVIGKRRAVPHVAVDLSYWNYILKLSIPLGIAGIINTLYFRVDGFMLSLMAGNAAVGFYGVAYKLVELTMTIPIFFMNSIFPLMAADANNKERLGQLATKAFRVLALVAAPVSIGSVVLAPYLARFFGGPAFEPAAGPMAILMVSNFFVFLSAVYMNSLLAAGELRFLLNISGRALIIDVIINLFAIPRYGTIGAATAVLLTEIYILYTLRGFYRQTIAAPSSLASTIQPLIAALLMGGAIVATQTALPWIRSYSFLHMMALLAIGAAAYTILGLALGFLRPKRLAVLLAKAA